MNKIQIGFKYALADIAKELGLAFEQVNLLIRFEKEGVPTVQVRQDKKAVKKIEISRLINLRMISARMGVKKTTHFLHFVQLYYRMKKKIKDTKAVELVVYISDTTNEICIGIYENKIAKKAFRLGQIVELLGIGKAELN